MKRVLTGSTSGGVGLYIIDQQKIYLSRWGCSPIRAKGFSMELISKSKFTNGRCAEDLG